MGKKRIAKRILALVLAFIIAFGLLPWQDIRVMAGNISVSKVVLFGEYSRYDLKKIVVQVTASGDAGTYAISYDDTTGARYPIGDIALKEADGGTVFKEIQLTGTSLANAVNIKNIHIGDVTVSADYSSMPSIKSSSAVMIDEGQSVSLGGENFDKTMTGVTMEIEGGVYNTPLLVTDSKNMTIENIRRDGSALGQNIVFRQDTVSDSTNVTVSRRYGSVFRVIQTLNMDLKYTPTRGEKGSTIYISFNNETDVFDDYSVFFLKDDSTDSYSTVNQVKASDISYTQDRKIMKVKVPQGLPARSYIIQLTNPVTATSGNIGDMITKRQTLGSFFITDVGISPVILTVDPVSGPNNGDDVQIIGKNFEELNFIEGFSSATLPAPRVSTIVEQADASLVPGDTSDLSGTPVEKLLIEYDNVKDDNGNTVNIKRKIAVFIGSDTTIAPAKSVLSTTGGGDTTDILHVRTRPTADENKTVDVFMTIETETDSVQGHKILPGYIAAKEGAYTFIPSYVHPNITAVTPDKIQIEQGNDGALRTKEDMIIGIHGKEFKVYKYKNDQGQDIVNYPIVAIGGDLNNNAGDIVLKKIGDKIYRKSEDGSFKEEEAYVVEGAAIEILNDSGVVIDGSKGKETGSSILVTLPKGREISHVGVKPIAVKNPVLKSTGNGNDPTILNDAVEFVLLPGSNPVIDSVSPIVTTIDSGEEITVKGSNFDKDVRVFISGREVPKASIKREIGSDGRSITLKFNSLKAPLVKEGTTMLMVMNSDGGLAVSEFTFVRTFNQDPKITGFSPEKGSSGTTVIVDGDNFLKPNPAISGVEGIGIYQLIGSRILMDGVDVNEYETNTGLQSGTPKLVDYTSPLNSKILQQPVQGMLRLSDYYHSVVLEGSDSSYYVFDTDSSGKIILSNGGSTSSGGSVTSSYEFYADSQQGNTGSILAYKSGEASGVYNVTVNQNSIELEPALGGMTLSFTLKTVFKTVHNTDGSAEIVGNRVKVTGKNRLIFEVPVLQSKIPSGYTITVQNPDTKKARAGKLFYYYTSPQSNFKIKSVSPDSGSVEGGYSIVIEGEALDNMSKIFEDTSKVYINGVLVPGADTITDSLHKSITVRIPAYTGDLSAEKLDSKAVPIAVVNEDGGTAYLDKGFTYVIPYSNPEITSVFPNEGSAAGGEIVEIKGYDFRFYEPKSNWQKDENWLPHRDGTGDILFYFQDIDNEADTAKWDGFSTQFNIPDSQNFWGSLTPAVSGYDSYIRTNIIPKVYFGNNEARVVEFSNNGYIKVVTPPGSAGMTDIYIVNNDWGVSNRAKYSYKSSSPNINSVVPPVGKKQGKDKIEILGSGFAASSIKLYDENDNIIDQSFPLVRFGAVTNRDIRRDMPNSGLVNAGRTLVELENGLIVDYNATGGSVTLSINSGDKTYKKIYAYDESTVFMPMDGLMNGSDRYSGFGLVKLEFNDGRLLVETGYSPEVEFINSKQLSLLTPSYYSIGKVPVSVINSDGGMASSEYEYKNPDSKPEILDILKEETSAPGIADISGNITKKVQKMTYKGGNIVTIVGKDFRENAEIRIGDVVTIPQSSITYSLPGRLTFTMPAVVEAAVGKEHRVVVVNEDGGIAASDQVSPPIYIEFTKGETQPSINNATPDKGPSSGGTKVKIEGADFRKAMEGITGKYLSVYFGETKVHEDNISVTDYGTIYVISPPHAPGAVKLKVENPDGELAVYGGEYTYLSNPKIVSVVDPTDTSETKRIEVISVEGGQEIKVKGAGFQEGAKVLFNPVVKAENDETSTDAGQLVYIEGKVYVLESGDEGSGVAFVDEETLKVTTPSGLMDSKGIIIINPDGGASNIYEDLIYSIPALDIPTGVKAELVYNKYIKVYWKGVDKAKEYEIYAVLNERETEMIGVTTLTSFMYANLKPNTSYKFIVKAVGNLGSSKASKESNIVKTNSTSGNSDEDGSVKDRTITVKSGSTVNVSVGESDYKSNPLIIDLTTGSFAGGREVVISMPASVIIKGDAKDITVIGKDYTVVLNPTAFMLSRIRENQNRKDAGVRFKISAANSETGLGTLSGFTAGLSPQYILQADVFVGSSSTGIDRLYKPIKLILDYDVTKAETRKLTEISLNRHDDSTKSWSSMGEREDEDSAVEALLDRMGKYMIIGRR